MPGAARCCRGRGGPGLGFRNPPPPPAAPSGNHSAPFCSLGARWLLASALGLGPAGSGQTAPALGELTSMRQACVTCPRPRGSVSRRPGGGAGGGSLLRTEGPLAGRAPHSAERAWPCLSCACPRVPPPCHTIPGGPCLATLQGSRAETTTSL